MQGESPPVEHICLVNLGLFRSGTTTLARATEKIGLRAQQEFPSLTEPQQKEFLQNPANIVRHWWNSGGGRQKVLENTKSFGILCDGWVALLVFLGREELLNFRHDALKQGVLVYFIATVRDVEGTVRSELQHWVIHDLHSKAGLDKQERCDLDRLLRTRATEHAAALLSLVASEGSQHVTLLPLRKVHQWPKMLPTFSIREHGMNIHKTDWRKALNQVGSQNANPPLPVEGILLTLRVGDETAGDDSINRVLRLLARIEADPLCKYLIVLGIDRDEHLSAHVARLKQIVASRPRVVSLSMIVNDSRPEGSPFAICRVWDRMAERAWQEGADWVVLLGDDIKIHSPNHYQEFYRAFLAISNKLGCPFGFGCPWWYDRTFPGFPTFPAVGKEHYRIFQGLIPENRIDSFVNQDLDPYLQRLYLTYGAAPMVCSELSNLEGGTNLDPRYERVPATGWKNWVLDDAKQIRDYLLDKASTVPSITILDVVVPTYRIDLHYLERIVWGQQEPTSDQAALALEHRLMTSSKGPSNYHRGNNIRVRCNAKNVGASASRNRGLDESAAEFVLFLDDDVHPEPNLLSCYADELKNLAPEEVGLVGLVRFPRDLNLPIKHAAVLMSYLTFMFEIAENPIYQKPAWGVTANILFRRCRVRFDIAYAKSGGGEDVDFCLRLADETGGHLKACPSAMVHHEFWPGSPFLLSRHFFNWAIGDSALFSRFPSRSWPNAVETLVFLVFPMQVIFGSGLETVLSTLICFLVADVGVEIADREAYHHRCKLLEHPRPTWFCLLSHVLGNLFVLILETGRLWGHVKRGELTNVSKRFDWHCGRLTQSRTIFSRRELTKFVLFVAIAVRSFQ